MSPHMKCREVRGSAGHRNAVKMAAPGIVLKYQPNPASKIFSLRISWLEIHDTYLQGLYPLVRQGGKGWVMLLGTLSDGY